MGEQHNMADYSQYENVLKKLIPWIMEQIEKSPDKIIRIKAKDIAHEMGPEFEKKEYIDLYWGIKYILQGYGIIIETGIAIDKDNLFVMKLSEEKIISKPVKKSVDIKIPIVSPEDIPSTEKRFFSEMIKHIESMELSYEEKIKFFDVMVEGSKFILTSFHEFEKDLEWYHADVKMSYVSGFRDALDKFNEILTYLSTYANEKDISEYFDLLVIGVNFIQNIIETGERLPEIINVVKDIDLIKKGEFQKGPFMVQIGQERLWNAIKYYINNMR